jgi:hypothetical protein
MADKPLEYWESLAERRIREAAEQGEFDDLPGSGRPLPSLDGTYDPHWWTKEWLRRTTLDETAAELRRAIRSELPRLKASPDSSKTRERIEELNTAITELNRDLAADAQIDLIEI